MGLAVNDPALCTKSSRTLSEPDPSLPSDAATSIFHRRFHAGLDRLRRMPDLTADAPRSLAQATTTPNSGLVEAAATHLPHSGDRYEPSHAGRLIHADITGPFISVEHANISSVERIYDN